MKRILVIASIIFVLSLIFIFVEMFYIRQKDENKKDLIFEMIDYEKITKIQVSTCMTAKPQKIVLETKYWTELVEKLKSYKPQNGQTSDVKGWEYYILIEQNYKDLIYISLLNNRMKINNTVYEITDYSPSDFLYLFKTTSVQ